MLSKLFKFQLRLAHQRGQSMSVTKDFAVWTRLPQNIGLTEKVVGSKWSKITWRLVWTIPKQIVSYLKIRKFMFCATFLGLQHFASTFILVQSFQNNWNGVTVFVVITSIKVVQNESRLNVVACRTTENIFAPFIFFFHHRSLLLLFSVVAVRSHSNNTSYIFLLHTKYILKFSNWNIWVN